MSGTREPRSAAGLDGALLRALTSFSTDLTGSGSSIVELCASDIAGELRSSPGAESVLALTVKLLEMLAGRALKVLTSAICVDSSSLSFALWGRPTKKDDTHQR